MMRDSFFLRMLAVLLGMLVLPAAFAELRLPALISDGMVLQRQSEVRLWGWDAPGQRVTVAFAGQRVRTEAGEDGKWSVSLSPLEASSTGRDLRVRGSSSATVSDVLVGEVWLCSGQSNMGWPVNRSQDADLEPLLADYPQIRLISLPLVGTQDPQLDFEGAWEACDAESVAGFSAVGYHFGRILHQALDVPIGLIDNAWGGSAAEAWVRRDRLEADPAYAAYLEEWERLEADYDFEAELRRYEAARAEAEAKGESPPRRPGNRLTGQHRPGNLYNGMLYPIIGYGLRGCIWYQGENNAGRAQNYRQLFPLLIESWRQDWGQGDFPFYWVQLADYMDEREDPNARSNWALLREAQTMTLALPETGQAVIIDAGEAHDIHPQDKLTVARRLARHALAKDYGFDIAAESPRYASHEVQGKTVRLRFEQVGGGMDTFDTRQAQGFAVAGKDRVFHWAEGRVVDESTLEVWAEEVAEPVAVRYAWADNPVANAQSAEGLPLTPFRTDDWEATSP